jgi:hypothetical protein
MCAISETNSEYKIDGHSGQYALDVKKDRMVVRGEFLSFPQMPQICADSFCVDVRNKRNKL